MPRAPRILEGCQTLLGFDSEISEREPCAAVAYDPTRGATACYGRGQGEGGWQHLIPEPRHAGHLPPAAAAAPVPCRSPGPAVPRGAARAGRAEPCGVGEERGSARRSTQSSAVGMRRGGEGSGCTFPRRRAELNSQRHAAALLSPPGSEPSANAPRPTPPRPGRGRRSQRAPRSRTGAAGRGRRLAAGAGGAASRRAARLRGLRQLHGRR